MITSKKIWFLFLIFIMLPTFAVAGGRKRYQQKTKKEHTRTKTSKNNKRTVLKTQMDVTSLNDDFQPAPPSTDEKKQPVVDVVDNQENVEQPKTKEPQPTTNTQQTNGKAAQEDVQDAEEYEEDEIELNFENADLSNFITQIEAIFEVTFITDDALDPVPTDGKSIKGNKISFKTHRPLSKKESWNLFITFLKISGFAVVPHTDPKIYRIIKIEAAQKNPIPAFIGVDYETLPDTDAIIRYVYFIENTTPEVIQGVIDPLRSSVSSLILLKEHKGFILTDIAYNIKMLMKIVKELDKVSTPETMSIVKLRNADAKQVADLYTKLLPKEEAPRFFSKKQPTSLYFPENTRIIAEPRTNALILLGPKDAIKKIEEFIIKHIDVELDQAYSPLYVYQLKYADATTVAEIMTNVTQFGKETEAGKAGGVRGVDQYMRPISFTAEKETNRLIIKGYYEDYLKALEVIKKLDEAQPQVAIEVLILSVTLNNSKSLGAQLRSKEPGPNGLLGNNIKFQTSGMFGQGIQTNTDATSGVQRLLGNLLNLVTSATPGNTIVTLGKDQFGVWGIFQALKTVTNAEVLSNPFLIATNKTPAEVSLGEERRVVTATIVGTNNTDAFSKDDAKLEVKITPQINSDGMIILQLEINANDFTNTTVRTDATKNIKKIVTQAIVANKEVLALGGLIRNNITNNLSKVPILGDIPILGWFFKNKNKIQRKENLLILISSKIIEPYNDKDLKEFSQAHIDDYYEIIDQMQTASEIRDPINRVFFESASEKTEKVADDFIFKRHGATTESKVSKKEKRSRKKQSKKTDANEKPSDQLPPVENTAPPQPEPIELTRDTNKHPFPSSELLATIQRKKRTHLSLSEFLQDKETEL